MIAVGLDLGQSADPSALTVLELREDEAVHLRRIQRWRLKTDYPSVVADVVALMGRPALAEAVLVVDQTGVGRPVVDMFRAAGLAPVPISITGGDAVTLTDLGEYRVPKRELVAALVSVFQQGRLKIAASDPLAPVLVQELLNFRIKINVNAHDQYAAWREGEHDDLVLAAAMAVWWLTASPGRVVPAFGTVGVRPSVLASLPW